MKRRLPLLLLTIVLLTACSSKIKSGETSELQNIASEDTVAEDESNYKESEEEFQNEDIPALENFTLELSVALYQAGVNDIKSMELVEYSTGDDTIDLTLQITTGLDKVNVECFYVSSFGMSSWLISSITDSVDTDKYYFVHEGREDTVDLYDYATGSIISYKSKELSIDDLMEDFERKSNEISEKFDEDMKALLKKYGLE